MRFLIKRWRGGVLVGLGALLISVVALGAWFYRTASQLAHPSRRAVIDYHQDFLNHPTRHGFVITAFQASDGTPALVCTPREGSPLGPRGLALRSELKANQISLPKIGQCVGTLVLLHGRNGRKEDYLPIAERLCSVGFRCILPDLPAHGDHLGTTATFGIREAKIPQLLLAEAAAMFNFPQQPAGLLGMSMGGSVAVHAAALPEAPWKALVILSSFDEMAPAVEGQLASWVGPDLGRLAFTSTAMVFEAQSGVALTSIRPSRVASSLRLPVLVAHGSLDSVIPIASGRRLFESLPYTDKNEWVEIPGANHENVLITEFPIYRAIARWMLAHVAAP